MLEEYLSEPDRQSIKEAVIQAEKKVTGEIVPYVVCSSDDYPEALWRATLLGIVLWIFGYVFLSEFQGHWGLDPWKISFLTLFGMVFGWGLSLLPFFRRWLIGSNRMEWMALEQARQVFLKEEVFATAHRTGILIFLSLFERKVVILADSGIFQRVSIEEWKAISDDMAQQMKKAQLREAILHGIQRCADLLESRGFLWMPSDQNELSDEVKITQGTT